MDLFEIAVRESRPGPSRLLVVATDEREAQHLVTSTGTVVDSVHSHGGFVVRGRSRIIGTVEEHASV